VSGQQPAIASIASLIAALRASGHLRGELPDDDEMLVSRWILALQAFGGWLAAAFLLSFVGLAAASFVRGGGGWLLVGTLTTLCAGGMLARVRQPFARQFLLPFLLAGQAAFAMGAVQLDGRSGWWLVALFEWGVAATIGWSLPRFIAALAALFAIQAAAAGMFPDTYADPLVHVSAWLLPVFWGLACALLLGEPRWRTQRLAPLLAALAAALVVHVLLSVSWPLLLELGGMPWQTARIDPALPRLSLSLLSLATLAWLARPLWRTPRGALLFAALAGVAFATRQAPGIAVATTALLLGFAAGRHWLVWLGGLAALAALARFYYWLPVDLLTKSALLALGGGVLLAARMLLATGAGDQEAPPSTAALHKSEQEAPGAPLAGGVRPGRQRCATALAGLLLVLVVIGANIRDNERILAAGQIVRLELAPVDPRSLLQGDYMALNYEVQNRLRSTRPHDDGYIIVQADAQGIGRFVRAQPAPAPGELAMRYRVREGWAGRGGLRSVRFATNAFFFEEGSGKRFEGAKYGEFRVGADGEPRLVALLDGELRRLGDNRY